MKIETTNIEELLVLTPRVFEDDRGYFFESFSHETFCDAAGHQVHFVQDNESKSKKGVLRGLHFQKPPFAQGKLVRVIKGAVLDVAVDIRQKSPTYGKHFSIEISEVNKKAFWIPAGFAHGFLTLEDDTIFSYKCTNYYNKDSEGALLWNDSDLAINWNVENPVISEKDTLAPSFNLFTSPFT